MSSMSLRAALAGLVLVSGAAFAQLPPPSAWPSLERQLVESKVVPGSALEALIRANQDFSMLRPEEAKDTLRLPPWLRVHWRKAHPEGVYAADDPTGGYPLVLKEIHEWLVSHQDLRPGRPEPHIPPGGPRTSVSLEQRISGLQTVPRSESDVRINFWNPSKILSASNNIGGSGLQAQYYSTDGGATWGQTTLGSLFSGDAFHSDPTVEWTADGKGWSTTLGIDNSQTVLKGRSYVSTDSGATWAQDGTFSGSQTSVDKQMHWVDHSATLVGGGANPNYNNQYVIYHNGLPAFMNRRSGGSWGTPIQVSGAESSGTAIGGDVKTNRDGEVFGFWPTTSNRKVFVVKSTDGGATYGALGGTPVQIATTFDGFDIGVPSFNGRRALIYVSGGAYKAAAKNLVYASWTDLSGDAGCTVAGNEPGSNAASTCKTRVWFSRSTNGGTTWSTPFKVNDQPGLNDQFNQWLAVDETTGYLGLMYYDTVGDAARLKTDVWYQVSFDDGQTWSSAVKVTSAQTDETAAGANAGNQYGDYNGLSGYAGVFFPSWTDRRNAAREEIWTAKLTECSGTPPGAPTIGTASPTASNQITVTWTNGAPASATYKVLRALGACAGATGFMPIATGVAATSYQDNTVSGGSTYAYKIVGVDPSGLCESPASGCAEATATGSCLIPPAFAGLSTVANGEAATCQLDLSWTAGVSNCGGSLTYNVYRSTASGFVPAAGNRIATALATTSYSDSIGLVSGTPYYYVVRAVDSVNGQEETNAVQKSGTPTGPFAPVLTETFETGPGGFDNAGWSTAALAGAVNWLWTNSQSQTPTHSWFSSSQASVSSRVLTSPSFLVTTSTEVSFWHTFNLESQGGLGVTCWDGATLEISTNAGASWASVPGAAYTAGGYTGTVSSCCSNPIQGQPAWCGGTGPSVPAMTPVRASLAAYAGQTAQLRWREGDDNVFANVGWYVDSVTIRNGSSCATGGGPGAGMKFYTLPPCRVLDTRNPDGPLGGPALQPTATRSFVLTGSCGVPADAKAVSANFTITSPTSGGDLRIWPTGLAMPPTSVINFLAGQTRANNAISSLPVSATGSVSVFNENLGTTHFLVDVNGYFK